MPETAKVLRSDESCPLLSLVDGEGDARAVAWPGVGSKLRSMARIRLAATSRTKALKHPMEAVYYVIGGEGQVIDADTACGQPLIPGSMAHIEPDTRYAFVAGDAGMELIGGPCPPDPALYQELGAQGPGV
jgi:hypothetical protein